MISADCDRDVFMDARGAQVYGRMDEVLVREPVPA